MKPNILIVLPDQMRAETLNFLGYEPTITPHLDSFANESLVLTQAISNAPLCSPARAMLLTGMYPISSGVLTNCNSEFTPYNNELKKESICWSDILRAEGYETAYIGKWHLDSPRPPYIPNTNNDNPVKWNEWCPPERRHGFGYWYAYGTYNEHLKPMYWDRYAGRDEFHFVNQWGPEHEADLAIKYILNENDNEREPGKPFALVVSMNPPHPPYNRVPEKYKNMYEGEKERIEQFCARSFTKNQTSEWQRYTRENIGNQYAMITGVDDQFGRILKAVEKKGINNSTIIVFLSDHGDCIGIHGEKAKDNPFEESLRIPFFIRWQGTILPGKDELLISMPDFFPTLLGLLGINSLIPSSVEGMDLSKILLTGEGQRPDSQFYFSLGFFSQGKKKPGETLTDSGERGIRTMRYTLVGNKSDNGIPEWQLWDRILDPRQEKNIADEQPEIVKELNHTYLIPWLKKLKDPWLCDGR